VPAPSISVIVTVFNRERYIEQALESILSQTLTSLELIVVDDGSTDSTVERVLGFSDPRLRLIRHERNLGIPAARNSGLCAAEGEFVAWLDSDDVALPTRLEQQIDFLTRNPSVALVGCCASKVSATGARLRGVRVPPLDHQAIKAWLLFRTAFQQSSITGRTEILKQYPYRQEFPVCEDVDMFVRIAADHEVANMPAVLMRRRLHAGQIVRGSADKIIEAQGRIGAPMLQSLGIEISADDLKCHALLGTSLGSRPDRFYLQWAEEWLHRLIAANARALLFKPDALRLAAAYFWIWACLRCSERSLALKGLLGSRISCGIMSAQRGRWFVQAAAISLYNR
jgi:glycosyltransferase involved in cell wall biosynthesis